MMTCERCKVEYFGDAHILAGIYSAILCRECLRDWGNYAFGLAEYRKLKLALDEITRCIHQNSFAFQLHETHEEYWKIANNLIIKIIEWLNQKPE